MRKLITALMFILTVNLNAQVLTLKIDTVQKFRYLSNENPITVLDSQKAEFTGSILGKNVYVFDLVNKKIVINNHRNVQIDSVYNTLPGDFLVSYTPKKPNTVGYLFVTSAIVDGINRQLFMYWEQSPEKTYGGFGYLD